jgi:hypothetical protein
MSLREIPRHRWSSFLDDFSRRHLGRSCWLDVDSSVAGIDVEAAGLPLQGIAFEHGHGEPRMQVFVGDERGRHVGHALVAPTRVRLDESAAGAHLGLRIDADEGAVLLHFVDPAQERSQHDRARQ